LIRSKIAASFVAMGAASLVLAGCGSSDSASDEATEEVVVADGDQACIIGTLLPQTGNLAFLGPPEFAGVDLAVSQINEAGGINGVELVHLVGDSGDTSTDIASQTSDSHIANGAMAIVGAASSGVSLTVIDKITGAGVVHFSPANTSPTLTTYDDGGLYFRTAPPDTFQGAVLGGLVYDDGYDTAAILALDDAYGTGLADNFEKNFIEAGGTVTEKLIYNPQAAEFSGEVTTVKGSSPKAVVLIGFEETTKILQEMIKQGVGPDKLPIYLVDGNLSSGAYADLPEGIMVGVKGTLPGTATPDAVKEALLSVNPDLEDFSYAPESWDAVNLIALAAAAGGACDGATIAANLAAVSGADGGEKCTDYASCKKLLDEGKAIDYEGLSGPVNFNEFGDPSVATMGIYEYTANDKYEAIDFITGDVPKP
jgi:ABC-type branched-subunit amino acid transport system substrate-binding protein